MSKNNKYTPPSLNQLQKAQLSTLIKSTDWRPNKKSPRSLNKGFSDTPLFAPEQTKLF
jgi:hypothetical protein